MYEKEHLERLNETMSNATERRKYEIWQNGRTGQAIVDAAMKRLKRTGFISNRLRMIVSTYLTRHMKVNWWAGERHFSEWLVDYDPSSNLGNWIWSVTIPEFKVLKPETQTRKYDPKHKFIESEIGSKKSSNMGN
jgi:deoxyribodipyrimidine photo-lyase